MDRAIGDITVLDFSRFAAGPYCTMLLADMGAQVIRVEPPGGGVDRQFGLQGPDGESLVFKLTARNKKSITLDILSSEGQELLFNLVKVTDVIVHNFTPGTAEAKVLDYETVSQKNGRLIIAAISGFGSYGPYAQRGAFDASAKAMSGAMWLNGLPGGPPVKETVPYADLGTGSLAAFGIMLALYHRQKTGKGQVIDASLLDTAGSFVQCLGTVAFYSLSGELRQQLGNHGFATYMNCFDTRDGWVIVMAYGNSIWRRLCRLMGREDMVTDPRFANDGERQKNSNVIDTALAPWFKARTVAEALHELDEARVPAEEVATIADFARNPQVQAREMIDYLQYPEVGRLPVPGVLPKLSLTPGRIDNLAPRIGEHNLEVYNGMLGISQETLSVLERRSII